MFIHKLLSYVGIALPFTDQTLNSMAQRIPIPTIVDDRSIYEKQVDDDKTIGWKIIKRSTITGYYRETVPIETSIVLSVPDRFEAAKLIRENSKVFISYYGRLGIDETLPFQVNPPLYTKEGEYGPSSWSIPRGLRLHDQYGNDVLDQNKKFIKAEVILEVFNPYECSVSKSYPIYLINLYQELLRRNDYYKKIL